MADKPASQEDTIIVAGIVMAVGAFLLFFLMAQCDQHSEMAHQLDALQEDIPDEIRRYYWLLRDLLLGLY